MPDAQRLDPSLLSERQPHKEAEFHELRNSEVLVQPSPQGVVGNIGIPDDRARVGQRGFLALGKPGRGLKLEKVIVLLFAKSLPSSLDGALDPSIFTVDGLGNVDAAELLDVVIADAISERQVPSLRKRTNYVRHVGANRLAFGTRRAFLARELEIACNAWIGDRRRVDVGNARHVKLR